MNEALTELENLYALRDLLSLDKTQKRNLIIPHDVQDELDALDREYASKEETLAEKISALEIQAKNDALTAGNTIVGAHFQVVFTKGGKTVSAKDLLSLADRWEKTNPEVAAEMRSIVTVKNSFASIQARKNA